MHPRRCEGFRTSPEALAAQMGIYQDENRLETEEVVVIGDGAPWIWNLADEYFPNATALTICTNLYVQVFSWGETPLRDFAVAFMENKTRKQVGFSDRHVVQNGVIESLGC